jgi:cation diffusion facilitator family transporter
LANQKSVLERGEKAAKVSSFVVALIGLTKGSVGFFSGSIALLAQAVDSLTDIFASLTVYVGLKVASRKPTDRFPYGYYRAETIASLLVAALIIFSGATILEESIMRFLSPEAVSCPQIALLVAAFSIPFLYFLAKYNKEIGEDINSQALIGQSKGFILDALSSVLVFFGVLSSYLGFSWIEAVVSALISVLIIKAGLELGKGAVLVLMDAVVHPDHFAKIKRLAEEVKGVVSVHDIKVRKSGPFYFGEMRLEVRKDLPVEKAHAISEKVELKLKQECNQIEILTIHIEPAKIEDFRIAIPIEQDKGMKSSLDTHFGSASHFIFVEIGQGEIKNWIVKPNLGAKLSRKQGITTAKFLIAEKATTLLAVELGEGPFHMLKDNLAEIYAIQKTREVKEILEAFRFGKLEKMVTAKNA